ncbi:DUF6069 family protein [Nocardiopsis sp. FR26]|uniref:DUF6069 family protein n=2 Tax=unclassified Nocardiopsis TaxID=2649073 RepID=UPI00351A5663
MGHVSDLAHPGRALRRHREPGQNLVLDVADAGIALELCVQGARERDHHPGELDPRLRLFLIQPSRLLVPVLAHASMLLDTETNRQAYLLSTETKRPWEEIMPHTTAPEVTATQRPRSVRPIAIAILAATAVNLAIFFAFAAAGASYDNSTMPAPVGVANVLLMTIAPMLVGMGVTALLARRWPRLLTVGRWAGAVLAIATIAMTAAGGFAALGFAALALMHVVVAAAVFFGLGAIKR